MSSSKRCARWLSPDKPADWQKLFQMWAFKAQNPLVKPQFALGCYGGQGIGKNFVLATMPQRIFGMSVKETSAEDLFGKDFALNAVIGSSFLIVNEAKDLREFRAGQEPRSLGVARDQRQVPG